MTLVILAMNPKKHIAIITTGGTIAAHHPQETAMADYSIGESAYDLVRAVPALAQLAEISTHELCHIDSRNMHFGIQHQLVTLAQQLLDQPSIDGVVITHGTDTLEETALLLHWCLKSSKPVVITGAMRPATALSADGPLNLYQAVLVACSSQAHHLGALLVMNDTIHSARFVQKMHTTATNAFGTSALGYITNGMVDIQATPTRPFGLKSALVLPPTPQLAAVDIIIDHIDANPALFHASIKSGRQAIVIAALGNGSLSPTAREGAEYAASKGVLCIRASRIACGAVSLSEQDLLHGTLAAHQFHATAARTLAALALSQTPKPDKEQLAYYLKNY